MTVMMGLSVGLRFAIGAVVLILLFVVVGFFQFCRRARDDREATAPMEGADAAGGVDEATLTSFPKVAYSEAAGPETETCCAICLAEYEAADVLRRLPACGHLFHVECVDPWLRSHGSCPFCRALLVGSECRNAVGANTGRRRGNWAYVNTGAVAPLPVVQ
ncbi:RING-H2 finger protein ATL70-like [Zingiber officinale]|uniref:RING-type domain-containing protein n=2 Tax=Zingiber officinale TaxID=94328 RepID=A0A8J5KV77_ZINOF|nr:RING-H2 finger protein ATL70-like [Zingiber officinale]XP_042404997.1 RING-H2 finger protein ATL70-like [Zingiber officinale]KAG6497466.1 hypothetical protein ZIOFF_045366 [Zingiber officinale]KAG6497469.1 hypothetical protein ZIOFF_045369 [Zingiber officinale]KAG6501423.1 hypothetical protein ZIOFF_041303 [Zingiber officinale]